MAGNEEQRNSILSEVFRVNSEIYRLQDQIRDMLQSAVNMDFGRLGYVEKITMDAVDSFDLAIENTGTHKLYPKEYFMEGEEVYSPPDRQPDAEKKYITYAKLDGKEKVIEGDDLGELMKKWKEIEDGRDAGSRIGHVDVIHNDPAYSSGYKTYRYEIATGKDITPVYLSLPYMGKEELAKTEQYLRENGAKFDSRKEWYVTQDMDMSKFSQFIYRETRPEIPKQGGPEQEEPKQEDRGKIYYSYAYNKDKSILRFSGSNVREIIAHWQKADADRPADNKIGYFYLKEKNEETRKYGGALRYEIATGKEVTPVYLKLPQMGKNEFAKTVQFLRENGAKFNPTKKEWYVTKDMDLNKFRKYLGKESDSKASVIGKLDSGRKAAEGYGQNHPVSVKGHESAR